MSYSHSSGKSLPDRGNSQRPGPEAEARGRREDSTTRLWAAERELRGPRAGGGWQAAGRTLLCSGCDRALGLLGENGVLGMVVTAMWRITPHLAAGVARLRSV